MVIVNMAVIAIKELNDVLRIHVQALVLMVKIVLRGVDVGKAKVVTHVLALLVQVVQRLMDVLV